MCPEGGFAPEKGMKECTNCMRGQNCTETGMAIEFSCLPGYQCSDTTNPELCQVKSYPIQMCILYFIAYTNFQLPTQIGFYNSNYNKSSCTFCNKGENCTQFGMVKPDICAAGYECVAGIPGKCLVGTANAKNDSKCITCPDQSYTNFRHIKH